jgi:hypothetical protein
MPEPARRKEEPEMTEQQTTHRDEYITIIAPSAREVMHRFKEQGLAALGYAINGRMDRHQFAFADADQTTELFEGEPMVAATFVRRVPA